jgi:hypothetical protein
MRIRRTLQCAVRCAVQCARGAAAGAAAGASALAVVKGAAVELPQWRALLRPAAQRAVHHRDAHMPRSSACGATSGAARAWRRSFAHASRWVGWAPVGRGAGLHLLCARIRPTQTRGRSLTATGGARGGCRACQAKTRLPWRPSLFAFAHIRGRGWGAPARTPNRRRSVLRSATARALKRRAQTRATSETSLFAKLLHQSCA